MLSLDESKKRLYPDSSDDNTQPPAKHYHHDDDPPTFMSSEEAATPPDSPSDEKLSIVVEGNTDTSPGQFTSTAYTASIHRDSIDTTEFGGRVGGADIDGVSITNKDGFSMKLRLKSNQEMERIKRKAVTTSYRGQLLFVPFHKLREEVEEKRYKRLMEETQVMEESLNNSQHNRRNSRDKGHSVLWSDKYSPKNFTDLLSDDGINRTVLSWMKLWDETVFGSTHHLLRDSTNKKDFKKNSQAPPTKKFKATQWEVQDPEYFATDKALDDGRRPKQKLFLLCGPPGLGKTTLAHIVAKHAGYNVVELNASDDRSPDVFKRVLESSTEMKAVLTANSKPNCLVIDEIDGAPANAINVLLDVVKSKNTKAGKSSKKSKALSRPIICICNDLYTPSLRTLRQLATVVPVPQTLSSRLSSRLLEICRQERMSASGSVLTALCEKTDNDIRTCLNTLQFIYKKHGELTLASIQNSSIGKKDVHKSHLTFLKDIFKLPIMSNKVSLLNEEPHSNSDHTSYQSHRFLSILSSAYSTGEYDKVLQGIYENYLESKIRDSNLDTVSSIQDWIIFYEKLNTEVFSSQEYTMMSYLPFLSVAFHFYFATTSGLRVKYPRSDFEAFQSYQKNQQILSSLVSDTSPFVRRNMSAISSVNFIPLLIQIITPSFRPVNPQLYTKLEKQILSSVIDTMTSYNLTYHQEQTPDGQYSYVMDPNIEQLATFTTSTQKRQLPYVAKQMLSREIELQKVKSESKPPPPPPITDNIVADRGTTEEHTQESSQANITTAPSTLKRTKEPSVLKMTKPKTQRDFFGRPIAPIKTSNGAADSTRPDQPAAATSSVLSTSLWFKFNKGFSDAVKRTVRMKDLM